MKLSGWGGFPSHETRLVAPRSITQLVDAVHDGNAIARGNGRAYGDSAIGSNTTINMRHFNHMIAFNAQTGVLETEAGVLLSDIIDAFLPRGWFPYVTPGTKYVSVGGIIAADVHGKNHHKDGSLRNFVDWLEVMGPSGEIVRCSPTQNEELFGWTVGGMGLTGIIVRAAIRLRPVESGWIKQRTIVAENIDAAIDIFEDNSDASYSVAWIDCLSTADKAGRSVIMLGEHASMNDLDDKTRRRPHALATKGKLSVPFHFPSWVLNQFSVRAFNSVYFRNLKWQIGEQLLSWDKYFYPLDAINGWNKIYGRKGFMQFQCTLPLASSREALHEILGKISSTGSGSFLSVLKRFGAQEGGISFPMEGYTLALDFPVSKKTIELMSQLDEITLKYGGRFYLAKDSRMSAATLDSSDNRSKHFATWRAENGLNTTFQSVQSQRLGL
ncbi:FAD-binding oxidoreductase [Maritalea porphyrae]|uniref:Oxidoreductase n=1 Tax=Maritalea porphyrae TaxID=880732 RepID=A0ABQ5UQN0_9HYPH|nr:FAD-binding oxidoreductase [Maritalea porphyrae]GLQ16267.1 oxidoreductase [Maritalea porphyrae]